MVEMNKLVKFLNSGGTVKTDKVIITYHCQKFVETDKMVEAVKKAKNCQHDHNYKKC